MEHTLTVLATFIEALVSIDIYPEIGIDSYEGHVYVATGVNVFDETIAHKWVSTPLSSKDELWKAWELLSGLRDCALRIHDDRVALGNDLQRGLGE